jgi:hypothetical protein
VLDCYDAALKQGGYYTRGGLVRDKVSNMCRNFSSSA